MKDWQRVRGKTQPARIDGKKPIAERKHFQQQCVVTRSFVKSVKNHQRLIMEISAHSERFVVAFGTVKHKSTYRDTDTTQTKHKH